MRGSNIVTLSIALLLMMFTTSELSAANCNTRTISGDWRGTSFGVACDLRLVASGNIRGVCYREHYDLDAREFYIETVEIDGRLSVLSNCYIDGNIRSNRNRTVQVEGQTWATDGNAPNEAVLMPSGNQSVSLF